MRTRLILCVTVALYSTTVFPDASLAEPPPLRNNPFSRPPSAAVVSNPTGGDTAVRAAPPVFDLRATMIGSRQRLANVGGRILEPGDSVFGYTLQAVFEDRAVFSRGDNSVTIYVKPGSDEDDE